MILLVSLGVNGFIYAQDASVDSIRSQYIREFPDRFYIKPILTFRNLDLTIEDKDTGLKPTTYEPINNTYLGVGLFMFNIGIELSLRVPSSEEKVELYGETSAFDFQTNIYSKRWGADVAYQNYEGFYVKHPRDKLLEWKDEGPYIQRQDLNVTNFQLNGFYMFNNDRFSYRSAFIQADKQLKSAGTFLLGSMFRVFKFQADSTLIPASDEDRVKSGKFTSLGILPGYAHNFVLKDFYLNLSLTAGPANVWTRSNYEDDNTVKSKIRPAIGARVALGYNSDRFFCGFSMVTQSVSYDLDNIDVNGETGNAKLFFGMRFLEKGFMKKNIF